MNEVQQQAQTNLQIMTQVQSLQKEFEHYKSEINNLKQNKNSENSNKLNNKINELSTNVEGLSKLVLASKTVVTAEGKTVLASDEVLRKEVEKLRNDVTLMMDAVKKQRMTLNLDAQWVADNLATRLENPTTQAIEKSMNVKISTAHQEDEKSKLLNLESLIHRRMIGQAPAVSAVANVLRRARAGAL